MQQRADAVSPLLGSKFLRTSHPMHYDVRDYDMCFFDMFRPIYQTESRQYPDFILPLNESDQMPPQFTSVEVYRSKPGESSVKEPVRQLAYVVAAYKNNNAEEQHDCLKYLLITSDGTRLVRADAQEFPADSSHVEYCRCVRHVAEWYSQLLDIRDREFDDKEIRSFKFMRVWMSCLGNAPYIRHQNWQNLFSWIWKLRQNSLQATEPYLTSYHYLIGQLVYIESHENHDKNYYIIFGWNPDTEGYMSGAMFLCVNSDGNIQKINSIQIMSSRLLNQDDSVSRAFKTKLVPIMNKKASAVVDFMVSQHVTIDDDTTENMQMQVPGAVKVSKPRGDNYSNPTRVQIIARRPNSLKVVNIHDYVYALQGLPYPEDTIVAARVVRENGQVDCDYGKVVAWKPQGPEVDSPEKFLVCFIASEPVEYETNELLPMIVRDTAITDTVDRDELNYYADEWKHNHAQEMAKIDEYVQRELAQQQASIITDNSPRISLRPLQSQAPSITRPLAGSDKPKATSSVSQRSPDNPFQLEGTILDVSTQARNDMYTYLEQCGKELSRTFNSPYGKVSSEVIAHLSKVQSAINLLTSLINNRRNPRGRKPDHGIYRNRMSPDILRIAQGRQTIAIYAEHIKGLSVFLDSEDKRKAYIAILDKIIEKALYDPEKYQMQNISPSLKAHVLALYEPIIESVQVKAEPGLSAAAGKRKSTIMNMVADTGKRQSLAAMLIKPEPGLNEQNTGLSSKVTTQKNIIASLLQRVASKQQSAAQPSYASDFAMGMQRASGPPAAIPIAPAAYDMDGNNAVFDPAFEDSNSQWPYDQGAGSSHNQSNNQNAYYPTVYTNPHRGDGAPGAYYEG